MKWRRVLAVVLACAFAGTLSSAPEPAFALDATADMGTCTLNGSWRLVVERYDADHLRVRFVVRNVAPGSLWQFFGTDNGSRIFSVDRYANDSGVARVIRIVRDRAGTDTIEAQAYNYASGNTCGPGQVSF